VRTEPENAQALLTLGRATVLSGRALEGLVVFDRALSLDPNLAKAHSGRGLALAACGRSDEALAAYQRAAELDPSDATLFREIGCLMLRLGRYGNAHAAFAVALQLDPSDLGALEGRTMTLVAVGRYHEALPGLQALLSRAPETDYLLGTWFHARLNCCEWSEFDSVRRSISEQVARGKRVDTPFTFLAHSESPVDQQRCARLYAADRCAAAVGVAREPTRATSQRLRVAYLSADFRDHAVGQLMVEILQCHDRGRIETYGISTAPSDNSSVRQRLERSLEHFLDVVALQDHAIAERMAQLSIDIVVDLGGHTAASRTGLLAKRPAPIQVAFLGYPGTSGAGFMDYIVADRHVIPESEQDSYDEQVIYLPDSYFPPRRPTPLALPVARATAGLPASGFIFACFNAPYKLTPELFGSWMHILRRVPESVLWIRDTSAAARHNLAREAERHAVDPMRLIYAPRVASHADHLARLALADLFLDTYPYNAHTTASDALRAGVPVITLRGRTFASRVATSLLAAVGLDELSNAPVEEYVQQAIEVASSPELATELKARLRRSQVSSPLFDPARYCRHLEAAYHEIHARRLRGERPRLLRVERTI